MSIFLIAMLVGFLFSAVIVLYSFLHVGVLCPVRVLCTRLPDFFQRSYSGIAGVFRYVDGRHDVYSSALRGQTVGLWKQLALLTRQSR